MESVSRRELLVRATLGLAVAGGGVLRADARPTPRAGLPVDYEKLLAQRPEPPRGEVADRTLVIGGRVWGIDTRRPVAGVTLDLWPTHMAASQPHGAEPAHRVRVTSDSAGRWEAEVARPACYRQGRAMQPARLHFLVRHPDYATLVTAVVFAGDPYLAAAPETPAGLVLQTERLTVGGTTYEQAAFDLVLAPH